MRGIVFLDRDGTLIEEVGYLRDPAALLILPGLTGHVNQESLSAKVTVILAVSVDAAGRPVLDVVSANIGPLPVPEDLISEIQTRLNEAFMGQIRSLAPNLFIESIVIEGGNMTITGRTQ